MDKLELYIELLKRFDWYWRQSEDTRFLERNICMENQIKQLQKELDINSVIYKKYCPFENVK